MHLRLIGIAYFLSLSLSFAEVKKNQVEINAAVIQIRPDGSGASMRPLPTLICNDNEEGKLFVGRDLPDGKPDLDAIRIEFTPSILNDGRIQIKVVSLGTELGDRPPETVETPKTSPTVKLTFHSALPNDGLFSVAGANGARNWLHIGQKVDGWTLTNYDKKSTVLTLTRDAQIQRLTLTKVSLADTNAYSPRSETVLVLPGEAAEVLGKDGRRITLKARIFDGPPPGR